MKTIKKNSFRVISGNFRGRKFTFPDSAGLRPTSGKIRETLFNWLQFEISHKTVLDLYGGSGALSIEALSRGVKELQLIEQNTLVYKSLIANFNSLGINNYKLINSDAIKFISNKCNKSFDLIFLDPPFNKDLLPQSLELLARNNYLNNKSKLYIESEFIINKDKLSILDGYCYNIEKQKKTGNVHYCLVSLEKL